MPKDGGDKTAPAPRVDVVQSAIGAIGRWQIFIIIWVSLLKLPIAWYQLSIVFLAPPATFWCTSPDSHLNGTIATPAETHRDTCSVHVDNSSAVECRSWEYDRSIFQETIITQWDLVCNRAQLANVAQTVFMFGVLLGNVLFGMAADRYGRKLPMLIAIVLQIVTGVITAFVPWYEVFLVLRFVSALATGGTMTTSFVICMEILGGWWRMAMSVLYHIPFSIGHSLLPILSYYFRDWHDFQLAISIPSIILLALWWTVPESPRWLLAVGKDKQAIRIIEDAAKTNKIKITDMARHLSSVTNQKEKIGYEEKNASILDLFRTPNMRMKTLCIYFNWLVCGLCFFGLAQYMGQVGGNIFINVAVSGLIEIPGCLMCIFFMGRFGRRNTLIAGQMVAAVACFLIMAVPQAAEDPEWPKVFLAAVGIVGMSVAFPTVYLFAGELFPTVVRNVGVGSSSMCARIGSMAAPFVASLNGASTYLPPLIFGAMPFIAALLCFLLPETANTDLPESLEDGENFGKKVKKDENGTTNPGFVKDDTHL